ncbi:MAG: hypothetical protein ACRDN6_01410 [Gaiellaceae bacterium]
MRRTRALLLFTLGYAAMALFAASVAAAPALLAFSAAGFVLMRQPAEQDWADRVADELVRGR